MAIDGHGHREPLPLHSRAYVSAAWAPLHPLRTPPSFHASPCPRTPLPPLGAPVVTLLPLPELPRRR
jgi:hypothetical protein